MQERVADSPVSLFRTSTCEKQTKHNTQKSRNLMGQFLGLVFWGAIGVVFCSWYVIMGSAAQALDQNNILLDFSATWCGPCQRMSPIVSKLERQGLPIRKVDVDVEKELTKRFNVEQLPCFILVSNGREIERSYGATEEKNLRAMIARLPKSVDEATDQNRGQGQSETNAASSGSGQRKMFPQMAPLFAKGNSPKLTPVSPNDLVRGQNPATELTSTSSPTTPLSGSVRIKVSSAKDIRYGSGTIIESEPGRAVILTCAHILRGITKNGVIEVDYFSDGKPTPKTFVAQTIGFDTESDLGLLEIPCKERITAMKIGNPEKSLALQDRVASVGCGSGQNPSVQKHVVSVMNQIEGPETVECNGVPEQGRSGGGLFQGSELVGVCIAADPKVKRGIYTGLKPVSLLLSKSNLGHLVPGQTQPQDAIAENHPATQKESSDRNLETADARSQGTDDEVASLIRDALQETGNPDFDSKAYVGSEIICIVRPKTPGTASRIVVVNQATSRFVDDLLRDSTTNDRSHSKATAKTSPRRSLGQGVRTADLVTSGMPSTPAASSLEESLFDEPVERMETAFEPQRSRR